MDTDTFAPAWVSTACDLVSGAQKCGSWHTVASSKWYIDSTNQICNNYMPYENAMLQNIIKQNILCYKQNPLKRCQMAHKQPWDGAIMIDCA